MVKPLDKGTAALIEDLRTKPESFNRDDLIRRAEKLHYHDYKSKYDLPTIKLVHDLLAAGYADLAENAKTGKYDQGKEEADEWMEGEGAKVVGELIASKPKRQGGAAGTAYDSGDQQWLRNNVAQEIEDVMRKHGVGGIVFLSSKESAAWRIVNPTWSGMHDEGDGRWRFKWKGGEGKAELTAHFVATMNDMTRIANKIFSQMFEVLKAKIDIEHDEMTSFKPIKNPKKGDA